MDRFRKLRPIEKRSRHEPERPFIAMPLSLIGGVAFNALSITAVRILIRLIAEHLQHAGMENGRLKVSYRQLAEWTHANEGNISPALAEVVDLGFVVIMKGERVAGSVTRPANVYRLTFVPDHEGSAPTDEWRRWEPSARTDPAAWRAASARTRRAVQNARGRKAQGKFAFRTDAEIAAAIGPAEAALKKIGKDKKIGWRGNKHTRAALNEVNIAHSTFSHPTQDGVGPPHAEWGGSGPCHPTRGEAEAHPTQDGAPSTSSGSMADHASGRRVVRADSSAPAPSYALTIAEPALASDEPDTVEPIDCPTMSTLASDPQTAGATRLNAKPIGRSGAPTLTEVPFPTIVGCYRITGRAEPVAVFAAPRLTLPLANNGFAHAVAAE
jgi:hypothetical protein